MYHHLLQSAKEVIASVRGSAAAYRRTMAAFNSLRDGGGGIETTESATAFASIRAPPPKASVKRGRVSNADLLNQSALKRSAPAASGNVKKTSGRQCATCKLNNVVATDHRTGSHCPFYRVSPPTVADAVESEI